MTYKKVLLLTAVVFLSLSASGCGYNTLTTKQQNVKGKWANVETQLQRRADLISNLVESAKLAGVQEQEVFGKIAEARSRLLNAQQQAPQGEAGDKSPEQKQAVIDAANSFAALSEDCWCCRKRIQRCSQIRTSARCRMKWRELETASRRHARTTTMACKTTTPRGRGSRP